MSDNAAKPLQVAAGSGVSIPRLLAVGLATRFLIDTGVQIFFPYLPLIAKGLGISPISMGRLVSLRSMMGLFSPVFGSVADRRGHRFVMRLGLLMAGTGFLGVGFSSSLGTAAASMILAGLGSFSFTPTLQAYLSNLLPYHQRARGLGILEYAWALAGIVGLFLVGQLLGVASWRAPFYIIGGSLLLAGLMYGFLPSARDSHAAAALARGRLPGTFRQRLTSFFALEGNARSAYANIAAGSLLMFGAFSLFISYGTWLVTDYGLSAGRLGRVALIMGAADLGGSVLVSFISDRFGKRRSVITGALIASVGFWSLPLLNQTLSPALAGLLLGRGAFEFAVVSNMTLLSEQAPAQRAKLMTLGSAFALVSSGLAGIIGPWLFDRYGIAGVALLSGASTLASAVVLRLYVREPADEA